MIISKFRGQGQRRGYHRYARGRGVGLASVRDWVRLPGIERRRAPVAMVATLTLIGMMLFQRLL